MTHRCHSGRPAKVKYRRGSLPVVSPTCHVRLLRSHTTVSHRTTTQRLHGQGGFTLSEFALVAVLVIGLIWVALVSVNGIRNDTRDGRCQTELRTLKLATEQYFAENDAYPVNKTVLVDARLLAAGDVENYDMTFEADATRPDYTATGDCA